ncbi:metallophosphoesterase [Synechococcales cyanobacterium C]|uniref:Metallophosphoesterase n=1 Tax=Petrachloros mirabilis ULC683 TaxID=2781853 RepID=A0A8K2A7R1_9CYAN|nr:metallophosphoesterase [Petrachloros mirabilis]NCJ06215.1 metallophosphoesterase [Petrachloros mirabilis ULC683]
MSLDFRFAILSDPHIGLPHTLLNHPRRFHLVEISIPVLEQVLEHLCRLEPDFLLVPGDLTQHGEPDNHTWLSQRLAQLPFPAYVIPGNHDVPVPTADGHSISWADFPRYYRQCGYGDTDRHYYTCELLPGVRLIALNSNQFDDQGRQIGWLDEAQLHWLEATLAQHPQDLILVMVHHNVLEHLPGQSQHPIGRRYMLRNAPALTQILRQAQVPLVFTGHLHVQDIAQEQGLYDITTGSLVSYPHPYRLVQIHPNSSGQLQVKVESERVQAVPNWPHLQQSSREWMGDRSISFMTKFLMAPPLSLPLAKAEAFAPDLRYFWATIADGDPSFSFPQLPPPLRQFFEAFSVPSPHGSDAEPYLSANHTQFVL